MENLKNIRIERKKWLEWKNIKPMREALKNIQKIDTTNMNLKLDDWIQVGDEDCLDLEELKELEKNLKALIPWRKGPFSLAGLQIDSEWQSNLKYNLLKPHFNLENKIVADVGCNNGYYMFRMLEDKPKRVVGFDPSAIFKTQFDIVNHFVKSDINYELLGVEHLEFYEHKFDFIFMLGVLYHRSDPIASLKSLARALNKNGEIIVDSFMIDGEEEVALCPKERYAMIPNIYFIPTVNCFKNWLHRAGFKDIELIEITTTDDKEQRVTPWTFGMSIDDFRDPNDSTKTIEGYPATKRAYLKAKKR
ncbi:MAG: tRNA 5-methoxyuridine(34)/uridine 5-oxyacetic acid(34) synthase CmoB [Campylobacterota bacterium]|nr:tRNA 5-methoxyuridine(34)/uridine 5-oxyacetic acid(34) synthase CmoB [Campylobacterota bacterium]